MARLPVREGAGLRRFEAGGGAISVTAVCMSGLCGMGRRHGGRNRMEVVVRTSSGLG